MDISRITGVECGFEYIILPTFFSNEELTRYANRQRQKAATLTKNWSKDLLVEWTLRNYLSLKMILASTLLLNSVAYAIDRNLRIVEPYLYYYSLLNTSRALLFSDPTINWMSGKTINEPHAKIITKVFESTRVISLSVAERILDVLDETKGYRELFSYRFPANGLEDVKIQGQLILEYKTVLKYSRLLTEIAQFNSEILDLSGEKNIKDGYNMSKADLEKGFVYTGYVSSHDGQEPDSVFDSEDFYRLGYFVRKKVYSPWNIYTCAREGLVEDFFGAWSSEHENDDDFDPCRNIGILMSPL